jgi:hypothetical protein
MAEPSVRHTPCVARLCRVAPYAAQKALQGACPLKKSFFKQWDGHGFVGESKPFAVFEKGYGVLISLPLAY